MLRCSSFCRTTATTSWPLQLLPLESVQIVSSNELCSRRPTSYSSTEASVGSCTLILGYSDLNVQLTYAASPLPSWPASTCRGCWLALSHGCPSLTTVAHIAF